MRNKVAGNLILLFDIVSLMFGFVISRILAKYISIDVLHESYSAMTYQNISERILIFSIEAIIALCIFYNRGHYKRIIPWWSQVRYIALTLMFIMLIDGFAHFAAKYQFSRLWIVLSWLTAFAFIIIGRYLAKIVGCYMNIWKVPTIIIGACDDIIETVFAIHSESYAGYDVKTLIINHGKKKFDKSALPREYAEVEILDSDIDMNEFVKKNKGCFYILAPDNVRSFKVSKLIKTIVKSDSSYALVPPTEGVQLYGGSPQYFFGHNVMFIISRDRIHSPFGLMFKRIADIAICCVLLTIAAPVIFIIALFIKMDGGAAVFSHTRVGKNNLPFQCLKFRSMVINAEEHLKKMLAVDPALQKEWDSQQKLVNDPRITKIGNFLRKTSLDELPQLINVLKGEMSLVGSRPIVEEEKKHYGDKINDYLSVKPGVTGLWQVSGRSDTSYKQRVYLDSWYVNNWSLWSDFVILVKTAQVLMKGRGAY